MCIRDRVGACARACGAGAFFCAGFLHAHMNGASGEVAAACGNELAGAVGRVPGTELDGATWAEVRDLSLNFWFVGPMLGAAAGQPGLFPARHPGLEAIFNLVLAWSALFAGFLADGPARRHFAASHAAARADADGALIRIGDGIALTRYGVVCSASYSSITQW